MCDKIDYEKMMFNIQNRRYTGSKYKLAKWIKELILQNCEGKSFCDIFAGTGIVAATMLDSYEEISLNDFLYSNEIIYKGFFSTEEYNMDKIIKYTSKYKSIKGEKLEDNYFSISFGNKFFRNNDAKTIGFIREDLEQEKGNLNSKEYAILLASLIYSMDRAANTVGHYDAYIKNKVIRTEFNYDIISPISTIGKKIDIYREDANILAKKIQADIVFTVNIGPTIVRS